MKRFIYLISPKKITRNFYYDLTKVFKTKKVKFFQLRLKKVPKSKIIKIGKEIKKITKKFNVKLIINDSPKIAKKVNAENNPNLSKATVDLIDSFFKDQI